MDLSTRFLPLAGALLISVFAVSCAQSGARQDASPTSPSSLSVAPSAAASGSVAPMGSSAASSPGASYDATGTWRIVDTDLHGNDVETFDTSITQDADGNLTLLDEDGSPVTLKRLGTGIVITYRVSQVGPEDGCNVSVEGTARLDTRTNTIQLNVLVKQLDCSHEHLNRRVTATKLS